MMQVGHPRHAGRVAATTPPAGMLTARTRTHRTRTRTRRSSAATGYGQHVARNRLRTLRRGDQVITWTARIRHVPGSGDCHRGIRVRAWAAGKNSQALEVDLLSTNWPAPPGACATDGAYPTSGDVRAIVDHALAHGWEPGQRGGTFRLTEAEHATTFELTTFLLTDRLVDPGAPDPTARVVERSALGGDAQRLTGA